MSKIDYQKLREIAEKTKIAGEAPVMPFDQRINALNDFMKHFSPDIALALLDERERNQQYIKRRDQENEEIALTVGKLRVELEAAENNLIDSECHVAELEEALRDKQALLEASEKRIAELEAELEAEPVSQTYNLPELIEGMEVSIDVSTCDADLGNRYFGTVTEALELDTAKNGYILLVQDAEPNFDVNGNSPVTPDGWISCSERIPVIGELNWRTSFPLLVTCEIGVIPAYYGFVSVNGDRHYGFMESLKYGDDNGNHPQTNEYGLISNVTHWMPLPEPPQEVK
ncbi:ead/Ea22-like family protein [Escherichia coli]|nr:ead/Ea22-like family protein [Escherichia coli]